MNRSLQETIDTVAIGRLHAAYADVINRRAWSELSNLFLPDATLTLNVVTTPAFDLVGPDAIGTFIGNSVNRFDFFEFEVLTSIVTFEASPESAPPVAAAGRLFMCEHRHETVNGKFTNAYGLYRDDYVAEQDRWWFARRRYQSLARTGRDFDVFEYPTD